MSAASSSGPTATHTPVRRSGDDADAGNATTTHQQQQQQGGENEDGERLFPTPPTVPRPANPRSTVVTAEGVGLPVVGDARASPSPSAAAVEEKAPAADIRGALSFEGCAEPSVFSQGAASDGGQADGAPSPSQRTAAPVGPPSRQQQQQQPDEQRPSSSSRATTAAGCSSSSSSSGQVFKNPLSGDGNGDGSRSAQPGSGGAEGEGEGEGATRAQLLPGIAACIQQLPNPTTAAEYFALVAGLDARRCPLGAELTAAAQEVYGPTIPFNKSLPHSRVLRYAKTAAPNTGGRVPVRLIAGHKFYVPILLAALLAIYCALNTVAYYRIGPWPCLLVMWLFFLAAVLFGMVCSFTDPGIAPRRAYMQDVKDRGDLIVVRVPAPNARAVHARQRKVAKKEEDAEAEAARRGGLTDDVAPTSPAKGGPRSRKRRQNTTSSGLERYFESATGKLFPVAPLFSEEERRYGQRGGAGGDDVSGEVAVVEFPLSYCWTCGMYKAPRTHHCAKCNCCIDDHDHHCPWTGCCIGKGNYRFFFLCLVFLHGMGVYTVLLSVGLIFDWMVKHPRADFADLLAQCYYLPPILYAVVFGFGIFFTPLFLSHLYMSAMGFTTSEMMKSKFKGSEYFLGVNPWDAGVWGNYVVRMLGRYNAWTDSRYYYPVTIAAVLEDKRIDWLLMLPPEERVAVQAAEAQEKAKMEEAWASYMDTA